MFLFKISVVFLLAAVAVPLPLPASSDIDWSIFKLHKLGDAHMITGHPGGPPSPPVHYDSTLPSLSPVAGSLPHMSDFNPWPVSKSPSPEPSELPPHHPHPQAGGPSSSSEHAQALHPNPQTGSPSSSSGHSPHDESMPVHGNAGGPSGNSPHPSHHDGHPGPSEHSPHPLAGGPSEHSSDESKIASSSTRPPQGQQGNWKKIRSNAGYYRDEKDGSIICKQCGEDAERFTDATIEKHMIKHRNERDRLALNEKVKLDPELKEKVSEGNRARDAAYRARRNAKEENLKGHTGHT